jgi:hypothetical protein
MQSSSFPTGNARSFHTRIAGFSLSLLIAGGFYARIAAAEPAAIHFQRVPDGGIQPQVVMDAHSGTHMVYFQGNPAHGDLFYIHAPAGSDNWSKPIQVNSESGSAIAAGSIRGAQLALGRNGRPHVAWNGSSQAPASKHEGVPMLYARLGDSGAFEPQRDLITKAAGLDGGGSVAADARGNVYVAWHAHNPGGEKNEANRAVFLAKSSDDGRTFAPERRALADDTGACGCCGMRAFADPQGNVYMLYRAASEKVNRNEILLVSNNGTDFRIAGSHPWNTPNCPMSSASFGLGRSGTLAAWETEGRVYLATVDPKTAKSSPPHSPEGGAKQKHPVVASNAKGATLLAWTEGTGWQKGGALAWQVFDAHLAPTAVKGRRDGIPVWSFAAVATRPDGSFVIYY